MICDNYSTDRYQFIFVLFLHFTTSYQITLRKPIPTLMDNWIIFKYSNWKNWVKGFT